MSARYRLIVIGASAGGLEAVMNLFACLPKINKVPIVIAQHQDASSRSHFAELLGRRTSLTVVEVEDKFAIERDVIYLAPPGYHLQVESDCSFSLSADEPVHFARPSIDVLFESAAKVYQDSLIAVLLTGANEDGAEGLACVQKLGGMVMVQDPETASSPTMPAAGQRLTQTKNVFSIAEIAKQISKLTQEDKND
jgi:two-component system chemotaxis response regulator CheB